MPNKQRHRNNQPTKRQLTKAFSQACYDNELTVCRDNLLALAKDHFNTTTIRNLQDVVKLANTQTLTTTINELEKNLYGDQKEFSALSLLEAWDEEVKSASKKMKKDDQPLPAFNP